VRRLCIMKFLLSAICIIYCIANTTFAVEFDDWVVSETCSQAANKLCHGYYRPLPLPSGGKNDSNQPIQVTADAADFVAKGTSVFVGNVVAIQGDKIIHANKAQVKHNADTGELETITVSGNVKIMQPGMRVDGTKGKALASGERIELENAVYRLYDKHARGEAKFITIHGQTEAVLKDSTYTTCAPGNDTWYLKSSSTNLNKTTGRGEAWNARMYLKSMPIFYFPYVNFPIDKRRQTGFLQPSFESSTLNGKTVIAPFYLNLAPNYDATITTKYMSLRSFKFDSIFRYITFNNSFGTVNFDFLPEDRAYRALRNTLYSNTQFMQSTDMNTVLRRDGVGNSNFRYRFALKNTTYFTSNSLLNLDYTNTSDGNYLYDFKPDSYAYITDKDSTVYALQRATLLDYNMLGTLRVQAQRYAIYHVVNGPNGTEQLSILPGVGFNSANFSLPYNFSTYANASYINFRPHTFTGFGTTLSYGQRFHIRPAVAYKITRPGWFIYPRAQFNYVQYTDLTIVPSDLANGVSPKNQHLTIPMYDVKTGLIFDRSARFMRRDLVQTLEPTLYYLYVPLKNQNALPNFDSGLLTFDYNQIFRDNRYTGEDYVGDANQLGMGVTSRVFDANSGDELGWLGVGIIRYFRNQILVLDQELDNRNLSWSPIAFIGRLNLNKDYSIDANLVTTTSQVSTASLLMQYHPSPLHIINFGYQYVLNTQPDNLTGLLNSTMNQISASSAWQVSAPWRLLGKINYDLRFHRYLETLAGFEYHTCCTAIRFMCGRVWMPELSAQHGHDNRIMLQFIFKGFGGVGNAENKFVASLIPGYRP